MSETAPSFSAGDMNRLAELAERLRDNTATDAEVAELETLLAESATAREAFAQLALLAAELQHTHGRFTCPAPADAQHRRARPWILRRWLPLAVAACLTLGALAMWHIAPAHFTAHGDPIATISNASGAILLADDRLTATEIGSALGQGAMYLRGGLLQLTYPSGVIIVLESPARFELRSAGSLWLAEGNASAKVPADAIGFTIETPSASIVDLGTEFGVSACPTNSEVHVFKGEVLVKNQNDPDSLRLTENRASRIDHQTGTPTGIEFQPERFMRTLEEPGCRYRDLIRQFNPIAYYRMRITPDATRLVDVSAQQFHGEIIRGTSPHTSASGRIGAGLLLGGPTTRSYAFVPDFPKALDALTICAWVRAESRPRWASIAKNWAKDMGTNHGGQFHFGLLHDEGTLEVHVHDRAGEEVGVNDSEPLPLGEWQFVAFTLDGLMLRLYRNGREVAAVACNGLTQTAPDTLALGVKLDATGRQPETNTPGFWNGTLDELAVFHRALTPAQILALYNSVH